MNNMNIERQVLQTKDLMVYLGLGKDKAYALMRSPSFPSTKIGKTYVISINNLQHWLDNNAGRSVNI